MENLKFTKISLAFMWRKMEFQKKTIMRLETRMNPVKMKKKYNLE